MVDYQLTREQVSKFGYSMIENGWRTLGEEIGYSNPYTTLFPSHPSLNERVLLRQTQDFWGRSIDAHSLLTQVPSFHLQEDVSDPIDNYVAYGVELFDLTDVCGARRIDREVCLGELVTGVDTGSIIVCEQKYAVDYLQRFALIHKQSDKDRRLLRDQEYVKSFEIKIAREKKRGW